MHDQKEWEILQYNIDCTLLSVGKSETVYLQYFICIYATITYPEQGKDIKVTLKYNLFSIMRLLWDFSKWHVLNTW